MYESIVLGGGCFWCLDAIYRNVRGVVEVTSGYTGGDAHNPTYEQVCSGATNHTEAVRILFDPNIISLATLLDIFWAIHNPTTRNQQGNDIGTQYRSAIYYTAQEQKNIIEDSIENSAKKLWSEPIITEVEPLIRFWPAEDYHQNYFGKNPDQSYCQIVINPKLKKFKQRFSSLITH